MPFKTFNNWLFDGSRNTPIPSAKNGIDILKYNSPITHTFVISMFLKHGPLNKYLDDYFNNIGLRYLEKEDLFRFIKKCVLDFKITRRDITFYPRKPRQVLYDKLRERMPMLKNNDILLLCEIIEKSAERDSIFETLDLEKLKKKKIKNIKKIKHTKKISLDEFLNEHFSIINQ